MWSYLHVCSSAFFGRSSVSIESHGLSNRIIFNDLERPQTQISRSGHSLTLSISEMAKYTAIVTMENE